MHFLIDADLPRSVGNLLKSSGHDVTDVRDIGLRGADDAQIAAYAQNNGLCLLSGDLGFADIRNYPPDRYHGLVIFRLSADATAADILAILQHFITRTEVINDLNGKLAIIEHGRFRIRK